MALSYGTDIRPLFRDGDTKWMKRAGVHLDDPVWMCCQRTRSLCIVRCPRIGRRIQVD